MLSSRERIVLRLLRPVKTVAGAHVGHAWGETFNERAAAEWRTLAVREECGVWGTSANGALT